MTRKRRRADGSLRPTYRRYRARKQRERIAAMTDEERAAHEERQQARRVWLANFERGARGRFFKHSRARHGEAIWLRGFARELGIEPQEDAASLLERLANERRWMKLRTKGGMVVGIAPPRVARNQPPEGAMTFAQLEDDAGVAA